MSRIVNGFSRRLSSMDVQSMEPLFSDAPQTTMNSESQAADHAPVVEEIDPPVFSHEGPTPVEEDPAEHFGLTEKEAYLVALSLATGELHYPMTELSLIKEMTVDHSRAKPTETQFLKRSVLRVVAKEGEGLSASLKWWKIISTTMLMLGVLTSAAIAWSWMPLHERLNGSWLEGGVLNPIQLAVVFSLGLLVQKLASFGWRRCLRLLWVRLSRNLSVKRWREGDLSHGASRILRKVRSSKS